MKRFLFLGVKLVVVALVIVGVLAWRSPDTLPPQLRGVIEQTGGTVLGSSSDDNEDKGEDGSRIGQVITSSLAWVREKAATTTLPKIVTQTDQEIVVEEAIKQLVAYLARLPQEQAEQVKQSFCQDVVDEALEARDDGVGGD
jgi:hypothetical protein